MKHKVPNRITQACLIFSACVLTSCASLLNGPTSSILVESDRPALLTVKGKQYAMDSVSMISVVRRDEPLVLRAETDSLKKEIHLLPQNSLAYFGNIFTSGVGFIIDGKNSKRFGYPRKVYFDFKDTTRILTLGPAPHKGDLNLVVSIPWINHFNLQPLNEGTKINTGFGGFSAGLEYYYSSNRFISLSTTGATDYFLLFPVAVVIAGKYEEMTTWYWSLTHQYKWRRLSLGYGIHHDNNWWSVRYPFDADKPPHRVPMTKRDQTIGIILNSYWQLGWNFSVGVIYRPSLWRLAPSTGLRYEHVISLDLAWRMRLYSLKH